MLWVKGESESEGEEPRRRFTAKLIETLRLVDGNGNGDVNLESALTAQALLKKPTLTRRSFVSFDVV